MTEVGVEDEMDTDEMLRRLMTDIDEMNVEVILHTDTMNGNLLKLGDALQVEAMNATPRPFGVDVPIQLKDAVYLPVLGGEVLRNGSRLASITYKVSSLERAINNGDLEGRMDNNKMMTTIRALEDWLACGAPSSKPKTVRAPRTPAAVAARKAERKVGSTQSALSMIDALMNQAKGKKK